MQSRPRFPAKTGGGRFYGRKGLRYSAMERDISREKSELYLRLQKASSHAP